MRRSEDAGALLTTLMRLIIKTMYSRLKTQLSILSAIVTYATINQKPNLVRLRFLSRSAPCNTWIPRQFCDVQVIVRRAVVDEQQLQPVVEIESPEIQAYKSLILIAGI
jgi:hypothetical protein